MADFFAGTAVVPVGAEIVATGDYKATDPGAVFIATQGATGLTVVVTSSAASGGGGVTVTISEVDPSTGALFTLLASALISTATTTRLQVDPRFTASANLIAQKALPSRIKIAFVGSGTRTTLNYSVSATLNR